MTHPVLGQLEQAAMGRFPPCDGEVEVVAPLDGFAVAGVFALTAHHLIAADVGADEVADRLAGRGLSGPVSAEFLEWLGGRVGAGPGSLDVLFVGRAEPGPPPIELVETGAFSEHQRVQRAVQHRVDVRTFTDAEGRGVLMVGRGVCGRFEASFEVDEGARNGGLGRALAAAALMLAPSGEAVFLQVAPGNAASLRTVLAAGYRPIGGEVLFWK